MLKTKLGLIGVGLFGGILLLAVMFSFMASDSSQAEFIALSDEAMGQLIGGTDYTKGNQLQSQSGSFANCNYPSSCPTQQFIFKPTVYACFTCYPNDPKHYRAELYMTITSWCDNTIPTECPYGSRAEHPHEDCETSLSTTC